MQAEGKDTFPSQFGRYTLTSRLATGGMAEVFKAKIISNHGFEKPLVIKRILPHLAADKTFVSMFIDEAKLTAQLVHPKIVQVTDFGEVNGQYFIALEFIDGFDALALLRTSAQKQLRIPIPISMFITIELLDALDYAHNARDREGKPMHLVHRDISPSNVFIARRGDVKLGDFGIAHAQERESKTQAGTLKGKYGYMSPEQVVGAPLDGRSDVFAVGIVLAEMLMGRRLFTAPNDLDVLLMVRDGRLERLEKYCTDIPPDLDQIVRKALHKRAGERFQTAAEFRDALADLLFRLGFRVGPPELGKLAADFFDDSPEGQARLKGQLDRWAATSSARPAAAVTPPPVTVTPPSTAAPAVAARAPEPTNPTREDATRATRPAAGPSPEESMEVLIDDEDAPDAASVRPPAADPHIVTALDDALSQPLAIVELDQYAAPTPPPRPIPTGAFGAPGSGSNPGLRATGTSPVVPQPAFDPSKAAPDHAGDLAIVSPMRVFAELAAVGDTGLARFETRNQVRDVYLVRGAPESVNANHAGDRFGEYLVARGFLRQGDLDAALVQLPRFAGKLGDALVGLGLMRPLDVFRLLSQQVRERVMELFVWSEGRFTFHRGVRNPMEAFPLGLDTFEILGAGVLTLSFEFLEGRFRPFVDLRPRAVLPPRFPPEAFRLGSSPRELWSALDGSRTLGDCCRRFGSKAELLNFLRTLYLLTESDLIRFG